MTEAICITGPDAAGKSTFVLSNIRSLNELSRIKQVAQCNHAILKGCRPADKRYTACGKFREKTAGRALGGYLFHEEECGAATPCVEAREYTPLPFPLKIMVGPLAQQHGNWQGQPSPCSAREFIGTALCVEYTGLQLSR